MKMLQSCFTLYLNKYNFRTKFDIYNVRVYFIPSNKGLITQYLQIIISWKLKCFTSIFLSSLSFIHPNPPQPFLTNTPTHADILIVCALHVVLQSLFCLLLFYNLKCIFNENGHWLEKKMIVKIAWHFTLD